MAGVRNIWIMAGETSGDLYASRLARELRQLAPDLQVKGMGMHRMRDAGVDVLVDSTDLGVVGFVEVLKHIRTFWRIFHQLVDQAASERPDCVVVIDYPGFNLRFAKQMHRRGIPVVYYVSPQVWAWGRKRIPKIATWCRKVLAIFPFEPEVYQGTGLEVEFVGHPLVRILEERKEPDIERDPNLLMLLPGSRENEIRKLLPPIARTAACLGEKDPLLRFVLPVPSQRIRLLVDETIAALRAGGMNLPDVNIVDGDPAPWFQKADAGLATSGTVTVEAAIYGLPLVSVYKVSPLTYAIARRLVKLPYFTMVNLVTDRLVFEEFIQGDVRPERLAPAVKAIMTGGSRRQEVIAGMHDCVRALGSSRNSCRRAAQAVLDVANAQNRDSQKEEL